jgi:hypothetical protein
VAIAISALVRRGSGRPGCCAVLGARAASSPTVVGDAGATGAIVSPAKLRYERLAAQRPAEQLGRLCGSDEAPALRLVRREHSRESTRRQVLAKLGPRAPVTLASALHARCQVVTRERG